MTAWRLALLVRNHAYRRRASRAELDTALAAAALDLRVEVYFLGRSLLQLAARRDPAPALLPAGCRGWSALPDLAEVEIFAERGWLQRCSDEGIDLLLPVQALGPTEMAERWRACDRALLL